MPSSHSCCYCLRVFPTGGGLRQHQSKNIQCRNFRNAQLSQLVMQHLTLTVQLPDDEALMDVDPQHAELADMNEDPEPVDCPDGVAEDPEPVSPRSLTVEDVDDQDELAPHEYWSSPFSESKEAGATFGNAPTMFELICDVQILRGAEVLGHLSLKKSGNWQNG